GSRWVGFTPAALDAGARAVFGFPLRVGGGRIGALNLYARRAGTLGADQHRDALVLADLSTQVILAAQRSSEDLGAELADIAAHQTQVNQAVGMVSVQLGVSVVDALASLRAHAYATSRPLSGVVADVVARRLRLEP
ncbi:MAG: ANTAR domain-containing protein, partial [Acidimicrobiales bacterium]